jgi:hypothetical protein
MNSQRVELSKSIDEVSEAARKTVIAVDNYGVNHATTTVGQKPVKGRTLLFTPRNALVNVLPCYVPGTTFAILYKFAGLDRGVLTVI